MLVEGVMRRELRGLPIASLVATLLAAVALVGCAAHIRVPFVPGDKLAGPTLVRSAPSEFEYIDSLPHPAYVITAEDAAYRTVSLAFPSAGENGQAGNLVTARYYRSKSKGAKPPAMLPTEEERREAVEIVRRIGYADGEITPESEAMLERIERILGLGDKPVTPSRQKAPRPTGVAAK